MKNFIINEKNYVAKTFDFNLVCDLEDRGVDITKALTGSVLPLCRAYLSVCGNISPEVAGNEIQAHIINGGTIEDLAGIISDEVGKSDFFRHLTKNENKEVTEDAEQASEKK